MKNNTVTNVLMIIIILLLIAFGVYYFINNNSDNNNEQNNTEEKTPFEKKMEEKKANLPLIISDLNSEANLQTLMNLTIDTIEVAANGKTNLFLNDYYEHNYKSPYEIASNVVDVEVVEFGQGGFRAIIFLLSDGTVSLIEPTLLVNEHIIELKNNIGNLKNIVDIDTYYAIDVDGNKTSLSSYFY